MHRGRPPNSLQNSSASSRPAATTRSPAATCTPNTTTSTNWPAASTTYASATSTRSGFDADQRRVRSRELGRNDAQTDVGDRRLLDSLGTGGHGRESAQRRVGRGRLICGGEEKGQAGVCP